MSFSGTGGSWSSMMDHPREYEGGTMQATGVFTGIDTRPMPQHSGLRWSSSRTIVLKSRQCYMPQSIKKKERLAVVIDFECVFDGLTKHILCWERQGWRAA